MIKNNQKAKIATAESCTGGLLAARIASEAGASAADMGPQPIQIKQNRDAWS